MAFRHLPPLSTSRLCALVNCAARTSVRQSRLAPLLPRSFTYTDKRLRVAAWHAFSRTSPWNATSVRTRHWLLRLHIFPAVPPLLSQLGLHWRAPNTANVVRVNKRSIMRSVGRVLNGGLDLGTGETAV